MTVLCAQAGPVCQPRDYGATGDGRHFDTEAIQRAINECAARHGGVVRIPPGVYLTRSLFLSNNITLQLDEGAILQATTDPDDWGDTSLALVNGRGLTNIALTGHGIIDGAGARWWPPVKRAKKAGLPDPRHRPRLVIFTRCSHVQVRDLTLRNSPMFHLVPVECNDVTIDHVTILAPADSPNTDGIDPSVCHNVHITHCRVDVGDDNVALKSGYRFDGGPGCEDIFVSDCQFLHGHGMSIGSETLGGVKHLLVERCSFENTTSGIRIKSNRSKGGLVEDVSYRDLTMSNVRWPISISAYYPKVPAIDRAQPVTHSTPCYRPIQIINLTATSPDQAGFIVGLPEQLISGVTLTGVKIEAPAGLTVRNADNIVLQNVSIKTEHGEPLLTENARILKAPAP